MDILSGDVAWLQRHLEFCPAWYLVSVNLKTAEDKVVSKSPTDRVMDIVERSPGAWAIVQQSGAHGQEY